MGILLEPVEMVESLKLPKGFSVCELGDQWVSGKVATLASDWYRKLGCGRYESIDGNGLGTITADLNRPLETSIGTFDLVTDFGTGEHVFDQAQVWRTIHQLAKPGGYIVFDRPAQGYKAHCYYRTDACMFQDIARVNNYRVRFLKTAKTERGTLIRGVFQRHDASQFRVPQQGRYLESLVIR
jgi:SAM-dependent methyltransferase